MAGPSPLPRQWSAGAVKALGANLTNTNGTLAATGGGGGSSAVLISSDNYAVASSGYSLSTSAYVWKGNVLQPLQNLSLYSAQAVVNTGSGSQYQAAVIQISSGIIQSVMELSDTFTGTGGLNYIDFTFATPVSLIAGNMYAIVIGNNSGATVTETTGGISGYVLPVPKCLFPTAGFFCARVVSGPLAVGQAVDLTAPGSFNIGCVVS